jgi:hypothetical protein
MQPSPRSRTLELAALASLAASFMIVTTVARDVRADEPPATTGPSTTSEAIAPEARASEGLPPPSTSTLDFELGGAFAFTTPPIRGGTSPFGMGFGGRAGLAFSSGVYVGLAVIDYLGSKDVDVTDTALLYGLELGFGFELADAPEAKLTLRPQVGVGGVTVFRTDPSASAATTPTSGSGRRQVDVVSGASGGGGGRSNVTTVDAFYVQPAITLMYATGAFFMAASPNVLIVPGITYSGAAPSTWLAYGAQAQAGLRF